MSAGFVNIAGSEMPEAPRTMSNKHALPTSSSRHEIGNRLKITREALRLRPVDVCRELGFNPNTYSQWESGERRPNLDDMIIFCERYGVPLDWIYRGQPGALPRNIALEIF